MMGYGGTDAPSVPPNSIHLYGFKRAADDIEELAHQLGSSNIILGGHDWGGAVVYRVAQYKPSLITALFSVCTPFSSLSSTFRSTEEIVKNSQPQFGYQLHLASGEIENTLKTRAQIREFLNSMYGGKSETGEVAFDPFKGVNFDVLPKAGKSPLVGENVSDHKNNTGLKSSYVELMQCSYSITMQINLRGTACMDRVSRLPQMSKPCRMCPTNAS